MMKQEFVDPLLFSAHVRAGNLDRADDFMAVSCCVFNIYFLGKQVGVFVLSII